MTEIVPDYSALDKQEVLRLIIQSLGDLGFNRAAQELEKESGVAVDLPVVTQFNESILQGRWDEAESLMEQLAIENPESPVSSGLSEKMQTLVAEKRMLYEIRREKFLECLEKGEQMKALEVLRNEITPLEKEYCNVDLTNLTSFMMFTDKAQLYRQANWQGSNNGAREILLHTLQKFISPWYMLPPKRLAVLLQQAQAYQRYKALYALTDHPKVSLYADYRGDVSRFPLRCCHVLSAHENEVWYTEYSPSGKYLATASRDCTVIIWDTANYQPLRRLSGHDGAVLYVAWSPDETRLVSCGADLKAKLWDPVAGTLVAKIDGHDESIVTCAWFHSGERFVTASPDKRMLIWSADGKLEHIFDAVPRIADLAISHDDTRLITISHEHKIHFHDLTLPGYPEVKSIAVNRKLTSISASRTNPLALVNVAPDEVQIFDVNSFRLVRRLVGQQQEHFIIRSQFGGEGDSVVASGSEDGKVYVWNREFGTLVAILEGHEGVVNSVAWNPTNPSFLASASDDKTVRIWGPR